MRNVITSSLTAAILLATGSAAFAGTTTNRITTGDSTYKTTTSVDVREVDVKEYDNYTFNVKIDAVGENAGVRVNYDNGSISGTAFANNVNLPDPFVNIGEVGTSEWGTTTTVTNVWADTVEKGNESFIEYSLDTDTGF